MATVGRLAVVISASTAGLQRGLLKSSRAVGQFGRKVGAAAKRVAVFGAAVGVAAAAGLAVLISRTTAMLDQFGKMGKALGIAADQLQQLKFAASIAGVGFDELSAGLRRFEKNISDAQLGLTTAVRAFEALGISADELRLLSPLEAMKRVSDALARLPNQFERARVAQDLFGRSGVKLLPLLLQGSQGIETLMARARELGLTLTALDISKAEMLTDSITELKTVFSALAQQLTVQLAPVLSALIDRFVTWATTSVDAASVVQRALEAVEKGVNLVAKVVQGLIVAWRALQVAAAKTIEFIVVGISKIPGVTEIFGIDPASMVAGAKQASQEIIDEFDKAKKQFDAPGTRAVRDFFEDIREKAREFEEQARRNREGLENMLPEIPLEPLKKVEEQVKDIGRAAAAVRNDLEGVAPRPGTFREVLGGVRRVAIQSITPGQAKEIAVMQKIKEGQDAAGRILKGILDRLNNPVPIELLWE